MCQTYIESSTAFIDDIDDEEIARSCVFLSGCGKALPELSWTHK